METHCKSRELLHDTILNIDLAHNDDMSVKTIKLRAVSQLLQDFGLSWNALINLFKTHTPLHPEIMKVLREIGDEEIHTIVAQIFVRNEKLVRIMKQFAQQGHPMEALLAIDGLGGPHVPNFEHKYYVGHLRFGRREDPLSPFDSEPEYKRRHVQTIREMYKKLDHVQAPEKQMYHIMRYIFHEVAKVKLPEIELDETIDQPLQDECIEYYMQSMAKEHIESLAKIVKRSRGDKRSLEREEETSSKPPATKR